jgi:hypothetical protein
LGKEEESRAVQQAMLMANDSSRGS